MDSVYFCNIYIASLLYFSNSDGRLVCYRELDCDWDNTCTPCDPLDTYDIVEDDYEIYTVLGTFLIIGGRALLY